FVSSALTADVRSKTLPRLVAEANGRATWRIGVLRKSPSQLPSCPKARSTSEADSLLNALSGSGRVTVGGEGAKRAAPLSPRGPGTVVEPMGALTGKPALAVPLPVTVTPSPGSVPVWSCVSDRSAVGNWTAALALTLTAPPDTWAPRKPTFRPTPRL